MEMSRDNLTPHGFPHRVLVSALQDTKILDSESTATNRWVVPDLTVVDLDQNNNNL